METILVIDDSPSNLLMVRATLERAGYAVIATGNAQEGLELARTAGVDLVTLDLYMEPLDGRTVLTALRRDPATAGLPVVAVTADDTPPRGAQGHVSKPFRREDLLDEVARAIGTARPRPAPAGAGDSRNEKKAPSEGIECSEPA